MAMTIRQCMDAAYQILNEYSIVGTEIPLSYNGHADLENRMINFINAAQFEIAETVKPIAESYTFVVDDSNYATGWQAMETPDDFDRLSGIRFQGPRWDFSRFADYKFTEDNTLYLPTNRKGTFIVEYYRFPVRYEPDVDKSTVLDNTPDTHEAIPYYIAKTLAVESNSYAYAALHNMWETKLSRLNNKPAHTELGMVDDCYGFFDLGGMC